jgi:hypothetical protein
VDDDAHEIERQLLVDEIDHQLRRWTHRDVRRGVRRLAELVRERLMNEELDVESRTQVAAAVSSIGYEPGWLPCDILTVSRAIRTGAWDEELEHPLCKLCRQKEDACTAQGWVVGRSKASR